MWRKDSMSKKVVYHISGFDCANCAAKVERFLNKQEIIHSASIDFNNERLYVNYKDEPLQTEDLINLIKEVEDDPLRIEKMQSGRNVKNSFLNKHFYIMLGRILFSAILMLVVKFTITEKMMEENQNMYVLAAILYGIAALVCLYDIVWKVIRNIVKLRNPIDMNLLLTLSTAGVFTLSILVANKVMEPGNFEVDLMDGVMVIVLFQIGELFEHIATGKSKDAISNAIDLRADTANLITDNKVVEVKPETLKVGDKIIVRIGEIVPADGEIIDGQGTLDVSSLTGEPMPVDALVGHNALSGSILRSGSITIKVNKVFADSTISKILELVQSSGERKAKAEKFITKFARFYTPIVFFTGILFAVISGLVTHNWTQSIFGGLAILVVSCPCAIVISVPLAYFAGIGLASRRGIVIKGANYLDSLCKVGTLFIDKTGTLTYGNFEVSELVPVKASGKDLEQALLAAESRSNHPIAKSILENYGSDSYYNVYDFENIIGEGLKATISNDRYVIGNSKLLNNSNIEYTEDNSIYTSIYVCKNDKHIATYNLFDEIKESSKDAIKELNSKNIETYMISGDSKSVCEYIGKEVNIGTVYSNISPVQKGEIIDENNKNSFTSMVGDGINDAIALSKVNIGIAIGAGTDVAISSANVILMKNDLNDVNKAIEISKKTIANIKLSLFWAFFYNILCIPIACGALSFINIVFNPMIAALAMSLSSICVVLNSLRLNISLKKLYK